MFDGFKSSKENYFLSLSVTPKIDNPKHLKSFAKKHDVDGYNWYFLTGDKKVIYSIARKSLQADFAETMDKDKDEFVHSESVYLIDREGYVRGIYNGSSPTTLKKLSKHMAILSKQ